MLFVVDVMFFMCHFVGSGMVLVMHDFMGRRVIRCRLGRHRSRTEGHCASDTGSGDPLD